MGEFIVDLPDDFDPDKLQADIIVGPDDVRIGWNTDIPGTVKEAKKKWLELKAKGYELYNLKGEQLAVFDESLGEAYAQPTIPPPEIVKQWPDRSKLPRQ
jgi:hypothetical protein